MRMEALIAAWHAKPNRSKSLQQYIRMLDGWEVLPVIVGVKVVGAVMARGPEIHVSVLPAFHLRWCKPSFYRWAITDRIKRYGYVVTRGEADSPFIARAGFKPFGVYNGSTVFVRWRHV